MPMAAIHSFVLGRSMSPEALLSLKKEFRAVQDREVVSARLDHTKQLGLAEEARRPATNIYRVDGKIPEAVTFCEQPNLVADGVDVALPDILGAVCSDDKVAEMTLLHTEGHMDVDGGLLGTENLLGRHGSIFAWIGMNRLASLQHR